MPLLGFRGHHVAGAACVPLKSRAQPLQESESLRVSFKSALLPGGNACCFLRSLRFRIPLLLSISRSKEGGPKIFTQDGRPDFIKALWPRTMRPQCANDGTKKNDDHRGESHSL